jgi:hypothetical protein
MKTPEELAEKHGNSVEASCCGTSDIIIEAEKSFLAGYQARNKEVAELKANWTFCCEDKARLLKELGQAKAAEPQWISVKDRLPENISDVLILTKEKEFHVGYYRSSDNDWNMYNPCCSYHMQLHGVVYWMPLPKPPEE